MNIENSGMIFVFGSNLAGRHGAGAALYARNCFGAVYGVGEGRTGQSYALPTKDLKIQTMDLDAIDAAVKRFLDHARDYSEDMFFLTPIGCGLAGLKRADIWPMFEFHRVPSNVVLASTWVTE
jgi:hypothetical protein